MKATPQDIKRHEVHVSALALGIMSLLDDFPLNVQRHALVRTLRLMDERIKQANTSSPSLPKPPEETPGASGGTLSPFGTYGKGPCGCGLCGEDRDATEAAHNCGRGCADRETGEAGVSPGSFGCEVFNGKNWPFVANIYYALRDCKANLVRLGLSDEEQREAVARYFSPPSEHPIFSGVEFLENRPQIFSSVYLNFSQLDDRLTTIGLSFDDQRQVVDWFFSPPTVSSAAKVNGVWDLSLCDYKTRSREVDDPPAPSGDEVQSVNPDDPLRSL